MVWLVNQTPRTREVAGWLGSRMPALCGARENPPVLGLSVSMWPSGKRRTGALSFDMSRRTWPLVDQYSVVGPGTHAGSIRPSASILSGVEGGGGSEGIVQPGSLSSRHPFESLMSHF